ncbi:acetyl-CoA carboxylase biotin carboxyl carrier protein [Psychrobacter sp. LV10R520-6]|uniref:acetyl-CoA carboxylase biotin carboxyl carrier protein n=1 Tax=Psychrobacter sp. LV10R520-6 TaxID=1415574 RepID=UPI0024C6A001|nr:biotin/lipoyl-containing protein [Psychrobacter sp. LV10R520-6]SNT69883.1 biotin carboxyl carrier protein [Psychrobacter sp. LV10R520-6]
MDIEQVARVVKLVEGSQLHEVTIANSGQSITVVNNLNQQSATSHVETRPIHKPGNGGSEHSHLCATHVGQVYLSEDDATDNLVNKGDHIQKGQKICFIDELTRLLPVISDKEGIVSDILVEDGHNIEYGQPIFNLEI